MTREEVRRELLLYFSSLIIFGMGDYVYKTFQINGQKKEWKVNDLYEMIRDDKDCGIGNLNLIDLIMEAKKELEHGTD